MSVRWERLAGDTARFAIKVAFQRDPDQGEGVDADTSASWGAFQLWVGGQNLCAHLEEGETVDSVHWYLLSLLEWMTNNWDFLLHEERPPLANAADDAWSSLFRTRLPPPTYEEDERAEQWDAAWHEWWKRHDLIAARDGGLFPDVCLRRWRHLVEVSWGQGALPGHPEHFRFICSQGHQRLDPLEVADALHDVVAEATGYLLAEMPQSRRLRNLRARVASLGRPAKVERRLALLAGLGAGTWRSLKRQLERAGKIASAANLDVSVHSLVLDGSCHAALMFGSVSPSISAKDVLKLGEKLIEVYSKKGDPDELKPLVHAESLRKGTDWPWEQGYELALGTIDRLSLVNGSSWVDVEKVLDDLKVEIELIKLEDASIRGVSVAGSRHKPTILLNERHVANETAGGRRFTLAHELAHILFDRDYGRRLAIASGPWAPQDLERRANAFAAMFLMPPKLVNGAIHEIGEPIDTYERLRALSEVLRTSPTATLEHLHNMRVIDTPTRDSLRASRLDPVDD